MNKLILLLLLPVTVLANDFDDNSVSVSFAQWANNTIPAMTNPSGGLTGGDTQILPCADNTSITPTLKNRAGVGVVNGWYQWQGAVSDPYADGECVELTMTVNEPYVVDQIRGFFIRDGSGPTGYSILYTVDGGTLIGGGECQFSSAFNGFDESNEICNLNAPTLVTQSLNVKFFFYGATSQTNTEGSVSLGSTNSVYAVEIKGNRLIRDPNIPVAVPLAGVAGLFVLGTLFACIRMKRSIT